MAFNPDKYLASKQSQFNPDAYLKSKQVVQQEDPGLLNTIIDSIASGGTAGFSDELSGGISALGRVAGLKNLGGRIKDIGIAEDGPTLDWDKIKDAYTQTRDQDRRISKQEADLHPVINTVGQIGGAIVNPLNLATGGMGLIGQGAALGAAQGLGDSEADSVSGDLVNAAKGAGIGAIAGKVGESVVNPALQKGASLIGQGLEKSGVAGSNAGQWVAKKVGRLVGNIPEEATETYLNNPEAVNNALTKEQLSEKFLGEKGLLDQFKNKVGELDSEAWNQLSNNKSGVSKNDLVNYGSDLMSNILGGKNGQFTRTAGIGATGEKLSAISGALEEINGAYDKTLSEADLKSIIQDLQKKAYGMDGSPKFTNQAEGLRALAGHFNDLLKSSNSQYANKMVPVAEATSTLGDLERSFVNKQNPDSVDKFLQQYPRWANKSEASTSKQAVDAMDSTLGTNFSQDMQNSLAKDSFGKASTNGSRMAVTIGSAGYAIAGPVGGAIGAVTGFVGDKYAGEIFKKALNGGMWTADTVRQLAPILGEQFTNVLNAASQRGPAALSSVHYLLQQNSPEYREKIKSIQGD